MTMLEEKIKNAQATNWLAEGLTEIEIKKTKELALISAKIESKRIDLGMSQKDFAKKMGVSQGMVSKWESGDYNFTINTLNDIFEKLNMSFEPCMKDDDYFYESSYKVINISLEKFDVSAGEWKLIKNSKKVEGIA